MEITVGSPEACTLVPPSGRSDLLSAGDLRLALLEAALSGPVTRSSTGV